VGVASVCVKPSDVVEAAKLLAGSSVVVSTVIGFPHGTTTTATKVAETREVCAAGAREVDMVCNIGRAIAGDWDYVQTDIAAVVAAASDLGAITKVIFETGLLPDDETKIALCRVAEAAGAAFVKTSTGFGFAKNEAGGMQATGATEHDIRLMRAHCPSHVQVKASGGIRSLADAEKFVALGATRLGTSATAAIAAGQESSGHY
jgi:deoxyribose-phosphate aldolase